MDLIDPLPDSIYGNKYFLQSRMITPDKDGSYFLKEKTTHFPTFINGLSILIIYIILE